MQEVRHVYWKRLLACSSAEPVRNLIAGSACSTYVIYFKELEGGFR